MSNAIGSVANKRLASSFSVKGSVPGGIGHHASGTESRGTRDRTDTIDDRGLQTAHQESLASGAPLVVGFKRGLLAVGRRSGAWRVAAASHGPRRLTVLAYHRIADHLGSGFIGYAGNASATPAEFAEQMAWVTERLHPITLTDLAAAVEGRGVLPRRPVLVTFDDGYRDNLTAALPVLERYGVPATVFLATDHIGSDLPFWWDRAAWALHAAPSRRVALPLLGEVELASDRHSITRQWVQAAKQLPDVAMRSAVDALPRELGVSEKLGAFRGVALTWDDVAAMRGRGVTFEAHTCSHPILTRVDPTTAAGQISRSVQRVAEATGAPAIAFAYPNGLRSDVDDAVEAAVAAAGIRLAFTLAPGPSRWDEVVRRPLRIRRVYLHHDDGIDRFVAKVSGLPRLLGTMR